MPPTFPALQHPLVQAPLAGGPSTPDLAAAVSEAGGLGFLAAGYQPVDGLAQALQRARELTDAPIGVNLFYLQEEQVEQDELSAYRSQLEPEAAERGIALGTPRFDDDALEAKLELVLERRVPIVSFTFGAPAPKIVDRLHAHGAAVWVTVTDVQEALAAAAIGADALVVQGVEAGGHRGTFADVDGAGELSLLPLLRLISRRSQLPLIAAGGIADGAGVAAVLAAGARAAQIGTAFMRCPEAATSAPHRAALAAPGSTALTRAFTGRRARAVVNRFLTEHDGQAPSAYPHVHHLTAPLRSAARAAGDAQTINLWAGEAHELAQELPAAELVRRWSEEARRALKQALSRLPPA